MSRKIWKNNAQVWRLSPGVKMADGGKYRMRNGHTALVYHRKIIDYIGGQTDSETDPRGKKRFVYWIGRCIECAEPMTWNSNGTHAAVGQHPWDLIERIEDGAPQKKEIEA